MPVRLSHHEQEGTIFSFQSPDLLEPFSHGRVLGSSSAATLSVMAGTGTVRPRHGARH